MQFLTRTILLKKKKIPQTSHTSLFPLHHIPERRDTVELERGLVENKRSRGEPTESNTNSGQHITSTLL